MSGTAHPSRTTALVGLLLAVLLASAYAVSTHLGRASTPAAASSPSAASTPTSPGPPAASPAPMPRASRPPDPAPVPRPGPDYPRRGLGALTDRSVLVNGRGNADLRYRRAPANGTRLHFICTGCGTDTWLVAGSRGVAVGGGPLAEPGDATTAVDLLDPGRAGRLLVRAPRWSSWTVTLTPFDVVPVHEQTFAGLGDDVVAVRARDDLRLRCGGAVDLRVLARPSGAAEYATVERRRDDGPGEWPVPTVAGADLVILVVSCHGRWTLTLP